ncbi:MAG: GNAT family N-acetyltransferase [Clostridiaceae bacterium]
MINKKNMMDCVYNQLAIDYNCSPDDFLKDSLIFTEAKKNEGRRPFPWITPRLEMISFGKNVVINASEDVMPYVRKKLEGKTRDEVFWMPFIYGVNPYFLPDIGKIPSLDKPDGFEYEMVEKDNIQNLFESIGLQYDVNSPFPEMLVALAKYKDNFVGMARANVDCKTMCQINVDVLQSYRGKGLASTLVNMLTLEILSRGYIPYYFTSDSNILSMRAAVRAGYIPAWVHCYKTRLDSILQ